MQEVLNKWSFSLSFWLWRVRQDRCLVTTSVSHLSQCGWPHPPGALPPGHDLGLSLPRFSQLAVVGTNWRLQGCILGASLMPTLSRGHDEGVSQGPPSNVEEARLRATWPHSRARQEAR